MRPKTEWSIDSETMRVQGIIMKAIIVLVNYFVSKIRLTGQKNIETKHLSLVKARQNAIQPPLFWFSKQALFNTSGYNI